MLKTNFPGKKYKPHEASDFMFISNQTVPSLNLFALPANDLSSSDYFSILVDKFIFTILSQLPVDGHPNVEVTEKQTVVWSSDRVYSSIDCSIYVTHLVKSKRILAIIVHVDRNKIC